MSDKKISSKDKDLFRQAITDVTPLKNNKKIGREQTTIPTKTTTARRALKNEVTKEEQYLSDFIKETVSDHTLLSYQHHPLPARRMKQLKNGDIPYQAKLDLHGFRSEEAKDKLLNFLTKVRQKSIRCVLVIHGKGNYSGTPPRIKNLVNIWLPQLPEVLAFHSAQPKDGGTGAVYVLLKRMAPRQ